MGQAILLSPDPVTDLCLYTSHGLPTSLNKFFGIFSTPVDFPFSVLLQSQLPHEGTVNDILLKADCSLILLCYHNFHCCIILGTIQSFC